MNPSLVIHYFDTKQNLIHGLIEYILERYRLIYNPENWTLNPAERLKKIIRNLFSRKIGNIKRQWHEKTDDLIKKVPIEYLRRLEGEYLNAENKEWKITFDVAEGILYGNDRGYRYKVLPVGGEGEFVNPDDGASLVFDTKDKKSITMVLFGRVKFKKVI